MTAWPDESKCESSDTEISSEKQDADDCALSQAMGFLGHDEKAVCTGQGGQIA
jgi:hypothetical protein